MSLTATMNAISYAKTGGVEVLDLTNDHPIPEASSTDISIKVAYAGVNFIDVLLRSGNHPTASFPNVIGVEISGTILQLPTDRAVLEHSEFKKRHYTVGSKFVTVNLGAHAEYVSAPWATVVPVPDSVSLATAVNPGDTVFIHTIAGGLGLLLTQLVKTRGATVIGTTSSAEKAALAREAGADYVIVYKTESTLERVHEVTGGKGMDAVFDGVGKDTFESNFEILKRKGTFVSVGSASGDIPPFAPSMLSAKNLKFSRPIVFGYLNDPQELTLFGAQLFDSVARGTLKVHIHKEYSFTAHDARNAHTDLSSGVTSGKIILKVAA